MSSPALRPAASAALVALAVFASLAGWAVIRPPLQSPDEPQHLMKANSVRLQPWLNGTADRFVPDRSRVNPLAWQTPFSLDKLFFNPMNALAPREVDELRVVPWLPADGPPLEPYQRAIATYPQVYYWGVHLLSEPVVRGLGLSPWDASYVYRLATCAIAAAIWGLAWHAGRRAGLAPADAAWLFAFVLLTPMCAFISSAVNPDAIVIPLCAVAALSAWEVLDRGSGTAWCAGSLLAAALVKPAGLQMAAVLAAVAAILALAGVVERRRALRVMVIAVAVAVAAFALFYFWQPSRFLAGGPSTDTFTTYLAKRWAERFYAWCMYWGVLGWLDYGAAHAWYQLMLGLVIVNAACLAWRPQRPARLTGYLLAVGSIFVVSTFAAEWHVLHEAGYTFQGRYALPGGLAFGAVLLHRVKAARIAMLVGIVALHIVLLRATAHRYYGGAWKGVAHALPFR
jgi:hypothetical protein